MGRTIKQSRPRHRVPMGVGALMMAVVLLCAGGSGAQTDRHTGRHRAIPPHRTQPSQGQEAAGKVEKPLWNVSLALGNRQGGDLFRLEVLNGSAVPWPGLDPGGFQSSRFTADFEGSTCWQASISRELGEVWRLRADGTYVRQDVTATALVGQTGARYRYDRMDSWGLGVGLERDLVHQLSAPYAGLAATLTHLSPVVNHDLSQTAWGARVSLGYRRMVGRRSSLFVEASLEGMMWDRGSFEPQAREPFDPVYGLDFNDQVVFFAIQAGIRVGIPR